MNNQQEEQQEEQQECQCSDCGRGHAPATTDDGQVPTCKECAVWLPDDDGQVVCPRQSPAYFFELFQKLSEKKRERYIAIAEAIETGNENKGA